MPGNGLGIIVDLLLISLHACIVSRSAQQSKLLAQTDTTSDISRRLDGKSQMSEMLPRSGNVKGIFVLTSQELDPWSTPTPPADRCASPKVCTCMLARVGTPAGVPQG